MAVIVSPRLEQACASGLDSFDLSLRPWHAPEAYGELVAVKVFALVGVDGAEGTAGLASNGSVCERGTSWTVQRAMLLGLCTVGNKVVRKLRRRGGWVHAGSVVDGS